MFVDRQTMKKLYMHDLYIIYIHPVYYSNDLYFNTKLTEIYG